METPRIIVLRVDSDAAYEQVFDIRRIVMQEELGIPEEGDVDGNDHIAHHYLAEYDGEACGTARWRVTQWGKLQLERFSVLPAFRGLGIGDALVQAVLGDLPKGPPVVLEANADVQGFWEKYGFAPVGEPYEEAGIIHQSMRRPEN